ncbi:periodic tryptophan protein 2 homolog [Leptopilina boulardi]|uniref:periodic tryptophan protein 2 homolog n=1 Tax=Leptopilina boulardi TaxID=63433 RepID=UPI0021F63AC4|nr:periodic tryptophan protein 2 homolog [Leptopilina boulardi]
MKCNYKFSNLLGTVYSTGDLIFSSDGTSVISPVGNRITVYDLKNDKSTTLPLESKYNYNALDLSPNGCILIAVNEEGDAHFISMISKKIIHKHRFKRRVRSVKFSPDGKHFAVCKENNVFIFKFSAYEFENYKPFIMERVYTGATDDTTCMDWSFDSKLLSVGAKDMTTRLYSIDKEINIKSYTFTSHSDVIVGCFFEKENYDLSTISRNGHLCVWECSVQPEELSEYQAPLKKSKQTNTINEENYVDTEKMAELSMDEEIDSSQTVDTNKNVTQEVQHQGEIIKLKYKRLGRHYLADIAKTESKDVILTSAAYHSQSHILVVGFSNGGFFLYELPSAILIHSLSIPNQCISTISINCTGDWIAVGCSEVGQLLVWEWQSESYCLKQQGHSNNMTCLYYSPNGQFIVTGGHDGKVKLWNTMNGFCIATFQEHTSSISDVTFSHNQKFIVSSSLDGSIRAYDLVRYRNFKTYTSPKPVQFSCLALDSSDEFLAAGGQNVFEIYLWSVKTGSLMDILSGHEGPVVSLAFNPNLASTQLASASWDKTVRLWNAIESGSNYESIQLTGDALCVVFRPDGKEVAVATLDGQISFFHSETAEQTGNIEGKKDLGSGRSTTDLITAKKSLEGKAFTSLCYSVDGTCILAGGHSKNVCLYNVQESILLKKFEVTQNMSLNAVSDVYNRRKMTEFGYANLIEEREDNEGGNVKVRLPGVVMGDMAERNTKPEIRVFALQFSPLGQSWAATTTEGLLLYSLNSALLFDPFQLDLEVTPEAIDNALQLNEYYKALIAALKLSEISHIRKVVENIPLCDISLTLYNLPHVYVEKLLTFIADELETTKHVQFYSKWVNTIFTERGDLINTLTLMPVLIMLQKSMQEKYDSLSKLCDFNQYTMKYFNKMGKLKKLQDTSIDEINLDVS